MSPECFAARVAEWLGEFAPLLDGLVALRGMPAAEASAAISALSDLRAIKRLRASWELWETLVDEDERSESLAECLGQVSYDHVRFAVWGLSAPGPSHLSIIR